MQHVNSYKFVQYTAQSLTNNPLLYKLVIENESKMFVERLKQQLNNLTIMCPIALLA